MFFYFITFGGYVGLANTLPLYFTVQFNVSGISAGLMVAFIVMCGSGIRPVGGYIADRIGGIRTLLVVFGAVFVLYSTAAILSSGPTPANGGNGLTLAEMPLMAWITTAIFAAGALMLGVGNGAVFQLIPQRFRDEIGVMTGLVGCAGGIGGFFLARTLGLSNGYTGSFVSGFLFISAVVLVGLFGLVLVKSRWRTTWGAASGARV
jgi:NNP family nitrate/nitrite transporter-like MFS transporter